MTSHGTFLSEVFDDKQKSIEVKTKQFLKRLKYVITKCFKKTLRNDLNTSTKHANRKISKLVSTSQLNWYDAKRNIERFKRFL